MLFTLPSIKHKSDNMSWLQAVLLGHVLLLVRTGLNWFVKGFQKKPDTMVFSELLKHLSECFQSVDDSYNCVVSKQKLIIKTATSQMGVLASRQFDM